MLMNSDKSSSCVTSHPMPCMMMEKHHELQRAVTQVVEAQQHGMWQHTCCNEDHRCMDAGKVQR